MNNQVDFLLGFTFSLLNRARHHLIKNEMVNELEQFEDDYQNIKSSIEKIYLNKEMEDGTNARS